MFSLHPQSLRIQRRAEAMLFEMQAPNLLNMNCFWYNSFTAASNQVAHCDVFTAPSITPDSTSHWSDAFWNAGIEPLKYEQLLV